tara:strand:+ start:831 stop:1514 length:684 start_codon:yes stop_codon:yes gene_type:complete
MSLFFRQTTAIMKKDLRIEYRSKERLSGMVFFAALVLLIFSFALTPGSSAMVNGAGGIFWVTVVFAGFLGLTRSFTQEQHNDCLMGLLLAPADRGAIYLGKTLGNFITMVVLEIFLLPMFAILLNVAVLSPLPSLIPVMLLGTLGFASVGTLFSAMSMNTRLKEAMLPLLTLPVLVPLILASVQSFSALLSGNSLSTVSDWLRTSAAFCGIFFVACLILFDYVVEES